MPKDYYQGRNLRGYSFKDYDLKDANFYEADIRGADFSGANLTNANLKKAKINGTNFYEANLTDAILDEAICGVKTWWTIFILIISLFIMSLSGFSASIIISCNFYFFSRIRGVIKNIYTILISVVYIAWLHAYFLKAILTIDQSSLIYIGICIILLVGIFIPFIETMDESKSENMQMFVIIIFFSIIVVLINLLLLQLLPGDKYDLIRRFIGAFFGSCLGILISDEAIVKKQKKYVWIWNSFVYIISVQGTKFHSSNLDDASLVNANIKGSSFFECTVMRTNWEGVKKIDCSRIQVNYLENCKIQYLLIQKKVGKDKDYQDMNLRDLNLVSANLNKVNLSRTDLSNSKLIEAKLQNSILSQTRLDNVDLSSANITGTTIERKSIPATAKLDGLICDFFYPQSNPTHRHPNTGKLTSEEAIKLLQKPLQINISFKQDGIDWQVFLQAFENCLTELNISPDNSEKLIQAFEIKLDGDFVIRLNVPDNVNEGEFENKLSQAYNKSLEFLKVKYRNTLKTTEIDFQENTSMLKITEQLANPGNHIIQNIITIGNNSMSQPNNGDINMTNNPGGFSVGGSLGGDVNNVQGDNNRAVQGDNNQTQLGDGNQVTQQNQVGENAKTPLTKKDVIKLLAELEVLVKTAELPAETKEEIVDDLNSAKKATDKEEPNKNRALDRLGSVAETLEKTSKTVESSHKIWTTAKPIIVKIATWLGAAAGSHILGL